MGFQISAAPLPARGRAKNGTESLVLPGVSLQGGSFSTLAPGASTIYYFPTFFPVATPVVGLVTEITTAAASAKARMSLYACNNDLTPGALVVDGGEVDCSTTGIKEDTIGVVMPAGPALIGWNCNSGAIEVRFARGYSEQIGVLPTLGGNAFRAELTVASAYGAFAGTGVAWTATGGFSQPPPWFVFLRVTP